MWSIQPNSRLQSSRARRTGRTLAVLTILMLGVALVFGSGGVKTGLAAPITPTACDQTDLQAALTAGQATITIVSGCSIQLTSPLDVGAGVNITITGNGLKLNGNGTSASPGTFDIIDIPGSSTSPSTLTLNDVTIENGLTGINDPWSGTIALINSAIVNEAGDGINAAGAVNGGFLGANGADGGTVNLNSSYIDGSGGAGIDVSGGASSNQQPGAGRSGLERHEWELRPSVPIWLLGLPADLQ